MEINFVAVLLAGIASMVIGFIWYGPLFANAWMKEIGLSRDDIGKGPGLGYLLTFVAALVMATVTSILVNKLGVDNVGEGALLGLMLGVGYVGTTFASNYIFGQKSVRLYLIDAGYQILNVTVAATIASLLLA